MPIARDDLPDLSPVVFCCLIGLVLLLWVFGRVQILRRQQAQGTRPTTKLRVIHALAAWSGTNAVLGTLAVALVAAMVLYG